MVDNIKPADKIGINEIRDFVNRKIEYLSHLQYSCSPRDKEEKVQQNNFYVLMEGVIKLILKEETHFDITKSSVKCLWERFLDIRARCEQLNENFVESSTVLSWQFIQESSKLENMIRIMVSICEEQKSGEEESFGSVQAAEEVTENFEDKSFGIKHVVACGGESEYSGSIANNDNNLPDSQDCHLFDPNYECSDMSSSSGSRLITPATAFKDLTNQTFSGTASSCSEPNSKRLKEQVGRVQNKTTTNGALTKHILGTIGSSTSPVSWENLKNTEKNFYDSKPWEKEVQKTETFDLKLVSSENYRVIKFSNIPTFVGGCSTLGSSLKTFGLNDKVVALEKILKDIRRGRKSEDDLKKEFGAVDKELLQLALKIHPDRVENKGETVEMSRAQESQAALNATRKALRVLTDKFLEDIDIEHSYEFYMDLDIRLMANEDEVKNQVFEVLVKICMISEIKQMKIVGAIREFLEKARECIPYYLGESEVEFHNSRDLAVSCLRRCINGYKKLLAEIFIVEEECKSEKLTNVTPLISKMKKESERQLNHLKALLERYERPLPEIRRPYTSRLEIDEYFVLPFVSYFNVIMMCNAMTERNGGEKRSYFPFPIPNPFRQKKLEHEEEFLDENDDMNRLYYLAACHQSDGKKHKKVVMRLLEQPYIYEESLRSRFDSILEELAFKLLTQFNLESYQARGGGSHLSKEVKMMKEAVIEISRQVQEMAREAEEIRANHERMRIQLDRMTKTTGDIQMQYDACLEDFQNNRAALSGLLMNH